MAETPYESPSDVSELDPESAVLVPIQQRIEAQLRKHLQEVSQQLYDVKNELVTVQKEREKYGVELYNAQQHLAKLQETLEKQHEKHVSVQRQYEEKLQEREEISTQADSLRKEIEDYQRQHERQQADLAKLTETIVKVQQFNDQLKKEVQVERRAAYKTEEDITNLEREKLKQDNMIDVLEKRVILVEEEVATVNTQIESQQKETRRAREILAEALAEMEAINFEKKQLVQQWKSTLIGMQRRHEAMKKTEEALQQQKDDLQALENEITGCRKDIQGVQTETSKLMEFMSRVDNEVTVLEKQIDALVERKEKSAQSYAMLKNNLEQTDAETKKLEYEARTHASEVTNIDRKIQKCARDVRSMENDIVEALSKQSTLKQEGSGTLQEIEKIKGSIRVKELQVTQMENELARIRVDTLQAQSHNETLKSTLGELEKELQSRGVLIERMQMDIRRRHDEIDRKQKQLDQLNHQYEGLLAAQVSDKGEHVGPLEATINSLSRAITEKVNENEALQQEWIKLQTELVNCKNNANEVNEAILELQAEATVLMQKRERLLANIANEKKEIISLENKANAMHIEMKKVNTQLSKNSEDQKNIANEAFLLENDLIRRLQEKKREAIELELKVEETRQTKTDLLEQIMNCERDILFWERKMQIAKETEMALDPTVGRAEVEKMRKEIGIMEKRMNDLQREQRFLVEEMQRSIDHREIIRTKGQAIQNSTKKNGRGATRLDVDKESARMFKELNEKREEAQLKERLIRESLVEIEKKTNEIETIQREVENLDEQVTELQAQLLSAQKECDRLEDEKRIKNTTLQRLRDAENGAYNLAVSPEELNEEVTHLEEKRRTLVEIIDDLTNRYPQLEEELSDILSAL
ncbi:Coiled-coil domain-containing protein 40-like [Trypanosoma cruzi]|nr:Coiled-coil domain-containing protein 40-like [Trypanosoma cruzi]